MSVTEGLLASRATGFQQRLRSMKSRAHGEAQGSCFMCFVHPTWYKECERFIEFSFEESCFHMDIPSQTLSKAEAAQISKSRNGFFYLSEGPEYRLKNEDTEGHDPFRAVYFYGDERTAAEDMAFIFYRVWGLSPGKPVFVTAAAFEKDFAWENDHPISWDDPA